jgi:hypothetical protein
MLEERRARAGPQASSQISRGSYTLVKIFEGGFVLRCGIGVFNIGEKGGDVVVNNSSPSRQRPLLASGDWLVMPDLPDLIPSNRYNCPPDSPL